MPLSIHILVILETSLLPSLSSSLYPFVCVQIEALHCAGRVSTGDPDPQSVYGTHAQTRSLFLCTRLHSCSTRDCHYGTAQKCGHGWESNYNLLTRSDPIQPVEGTTFTCATTTLTTPRTMYYDCTDPISSLLSSTVYTHHLHGLSPSYTAMTSNHRPKNTCTNMKELSRI